jgi:hypothetical protein
VSEGKRVENVDLSRRRVHGLDLEGAKVTDAYLRGADISGNIEGLRLNGVDVGPLVGAELDRRFPERVLLRAPDVDGLRRAWSMLEGLWAETTERAARLPEELQHRRVDGEWSFVETLRHLVMATDCWLFRGVELRPRPYHPWGLAWSGPGDSWAEEMGLDLHAAPSLAEIRPVREDHQRAVRQTLAALDDGALADVRTPPDDGGHPSGPHSVLHCLHVLCDEEWEHHRYAVRDLSILQNQQTGTGQRP